MVEVAERHLVEKDVSSLNMFWVEVYWNHLLGTRFLVNREMVEIDRDRTPQEIETEVLYGATGGAVVDRGDFLCVGLKMGKEEGAGCSSSTISRLSTSVLLASLVLAMLPGSRQRRLPVHQPSPISH
eukprot:scaffold2185_cov160-Alexandrium_tamarense.AAC.3